MSNQLTKLLRDIIWRKQSKLKVGLENKSKIDNLVIQSKKKTDMPYK
jgi:hypothetical protein